MNSLKIYKSSAGSGKTFTLVLEYLKLVLFSPEDYKSILAVTFTNKAAEEMKNRIIDALVSLSLGGENPIRKILEVELPGTDLTVRAKKALKNILHDYSSFSVCTIDSFFQRILRALAREIHLPLKMQVEMELDDAILDVTERLLKEVGVDNELTEWLTKLALQKMNDDKGWNLDKDIESVARELFKEKLHNAKTLSREEIHNFYLTLESVRREFEKRMKNSGIEIIGIIEKNGLAISDFSHGKSGVAAYFEKICDSGNTDNYKPGKRVMEALDDSEKWAAKKSGVRDKIIELADSFLIPQLQKVTAYFETEFKNYLTSVEILKKIYLFGIVNDLQKKFTDYRNENNVILISDTTRLLHDVIGGDDAPFLYEKTGNRYKHLLIDEFQDTSLLQWKNLLPLIVNTLGSGFMTLVVGDAKQSIYRWRGGNMNLLLRDVFTDLKNFKSLLKEEVLSVNYRSKKEIVGFNNDFFTLAPQLLNEQIKMNDFPLLQLAYNPDLVQNVPEKNDSGGFVSIKFLEKDISDEEEIASWKKPALKELLKTIHEQLSKGYSFRDICILVRKNSEGNEIANWLFDNGIEDLLSSDSLLITASPKIIFLINILLFLNDNSNVIARSEILYYYVKYISKNNEGEWHEIFADHKKSGNKSKKRKVKTLFEGLEENVFNRLLPESFTSHISYLAKFPVYELVEQLVSIFNLNIKPDAYIQRFQDLVLEYSAKVNSSLNGFLQYWNESNNVKNCSVIIPENTDAIRIMTIHSSKGLQFPIVLIPYADWKLMPKANEIIWMSTEPTPYPEIGTVAVMTSSKLNDTYFSDEYSHEVNQTIIDNLNLLYVAFTRAKEKLIITCPEDGEKDLNSIAKLIYRTCQKMNFKSTDGSFESGNNLDKKIILAEKENSVSTTQLRDYPSTRWQGKLALSSHSGNLLSMLEDRKLTRINYGILVHAVLAEIRKRSEIDEVVERIVFEGLIGDEEKKNLTKELHEILSVPEIADYFHPSYTVFAEREIILPGGEILRPDRVIEKDSSAIVIDFKTGRRENKHETQIKQYADVLRTMNFKKVEAKIIYLAEKKIVDVN